MLKISNAPSKGTCSKCTRYQKQIARLKKALKDEAEESLHQCIQQERQISDLAYERLFVDKLLKDSKAEIKRLKAEHSSRNQNKKRALEKVDRPNSNANLHAPFALNPEVKENDYQ